MWFNFQLAKAYVDAEMPKKAKVAINHGLIVAREMEYGEDAFNNLA